MNAYTKTFLLVVILFSAFTTVPTNAQFYDGYGWPWFGYGGLGYGGLGYGYGYSTICCSVSLPFYGGFFGKR